MGLVYQMGFGLLDGRALGWDEINEFHGSAVEGDFRGPANIAAVGSEQAVGLNDGGGLCCCHHEKRINPRG